MNHDIDAPEGSYTGVECVQKSSLTGVKKCRKYLKFLQQISRGPEITLQVYRPCVSIYLCREYLELVQVFTLVRCEIYLNANQVGLLLKQNINNNLPFTFSLNVRSRHISSCGAGHSKPVYKRIKKLVPRERAKPARKEVKKRATPERNKPEKAKPGLKRATPERNKPERAKPGLKRATPERNKPERAKPGLKRATPERNKPEKAKPGLKRATPERNKPERAKPGLKRATPERNKPERAKPGLKRATPERNKPERAKPGLKRTPNLQTRKKKSNSRAKQARKTQKPDGRSHTDSSPNLHKITDHGNLHWMSARLINDIADLNTYANMISSFEYIM
ncbi:anti-sigma-I factor RsgI8-like [Penaeus japonicus]|uniref:anti-sigma-I factor RsgI8-like n=1 Tax=Penaeus japonicus TaxID=27405 RepID=UPI001C715715|nr:anti-sigma-I factor RsgI8-like [Penaeus japonicus]